MVVNRFYWHKCPTGKFLQRKFKLQPSFKLKICVNLWTFKTASTCRILKLFFICKSKQNSEGIQKKTRLHRRISCSDVSFFHSLSRYKKDCVVFINHCKGTAIFWFLQGQKYVLQPVFLLNQNVKHIKNNTIISNSVNCLFENKFEILFFFVVRATAKRATARVSPTKKST